MDLAQRLPAHLEIVLRAADSLRPASQTAVSVDVLVAPPTAGHWTGSACLRGRLSRETGTSRVTGTPLLPGASPPGCRSKAACWVR